MYAHCPALDALTRARSTGYSTRCDPFRLEIVCSPSRPPDDQPCSNPGPQGGTHHPLRNRWSPRPAVEKSRA